MALTFDAGGNDRGVASVLATLARERVPGTFFPTANWVRAYPSSARAICASQLVGDHSVSHPYFTQLSDAQIRAEVLDAAAAIRRECGDGPAPLFRFPYGDRDARTIAAVNGAGYVTVRWTVDTLGWQGTSAGRTASTVVARVRETLAPGQIVLMHVGAHPQDGSTLDADALPAVIAMVRAQGYGFVSLNALLG